MERRNQLKRVQENTMEWSPRVYSATNSAGYICFSECARKPVEKDDMSSHFVASLHPVGFVSM